MVDAARMLGYSYPRALWKVLVPNILPGFVSGALFAFIASFDNYPVSIFLVDVRTKTLPIQLLNQLEMSPDPTVAAASALLILGTIVALDHLRPLGRPATDGFDLSTASCGSSRPQLAQSLTVSGAANSISVRLASGEVATRRALQDLPDMTASR